jgi:hypothetical protein
VQHLKRNRYAQVVDIDPNLLRRSAEAATHAGNEGVGHVLAEMTGKVSEIAKTLAPEGPYGYTIRQQLSEDGTLRVPILSSREAIVAEYTAVRSQSDILSHKAIIDIRGAWYLFHDVINVARGTASGQVSEHNTLVLCPVKGSSAGITGEIFWYRSPREKLGRGDNFAHADLTPRAMKLVLYDMHETYLDALRRSDADAMAALMNDSIQLAVRDYVSDSGTLTQPAQKAERDMYRAQWRAFFDKFEVLNVDLLERVVEEWYVFAELRFSCRVRENGEQVAFNTAEFLVPAKDGLFIAQIGHGTDIVAAADAA